MKKILFCVIIIFFAFGCKTPQHAVFKIEGKLLPVSDTIVPDADYVEFILPYKNSVDENLNSVLAYNKNDMIKTDGGLNSSIGNMMADIVFIQADSAFFMQKQKNIDFVLLNYGGIRAGMPKGNVTQRTAFEIMPFENEIVILELSGYSVEKMIEYLQNAKTAHPVSGVQIIFDKNNQLVDFTIQNKPFDLHKTYFVATSDFLKNGGDSMNFFAEAKNEFPINYKIRNALTDYFKKVDTLDYKTDNRFIRK